MYSLGIDIGSTTIKIALLESDGKLAYSVYRRHLSDIAGAVRQITTEIQKAVGDKPFRIAVTGSVGIGLAERHGLKFVQEVVAAAEYTRMVHPDVRTMIDIGGEDAKIVYLQNGKVIDLRMNGNCAGGTGAFIDQMALCLGVEVQELNNLAEKAANIYPIASRCGVFSKTDVQNLITRNISKEDISASVFRAVAVQTASTLSHGMEVLPKVLMCGGPLCFIPALRKAVARYFGLDAERDVIAGEQSHLVPAWGCALSLTEEDEVLNFEELQKKLSEETEQTSDAVHYPTSVELPPIFRDEADYLQWKAAKADTDVPLLPLDRFPAGEQGYIGVDCGSTTTKIVLTDRKGAIYYQYYVHNGGNPIAAVRTGLERLASKCQKAKTDIPVAGACSTGYGENLIKTAFNLDDGIVETIAHYIAAQRMCEEVSFILDIGGQDMKAIYVENGALTRMEINEACSSGCGSFIETFAQSMQMYIDHFVGMACQSRHPSDLGTRCTVFMNSKVKQVLRDGATAGDIAAGLAYSVVKNCLFKVLKIKNYAELGEHIVLQGGTMRNDAVVKAFENLTGRQVYRNNIPELMGAYGCALYAIGQANGHARPISELLAMAETESRPLNCKGCENHCRITCYTFASGKRYYSGNKCERVFTNGQKSEYKGVNLSLERYNELFNRAEYNEPPKEQALLTLGIPRVLNMYEEFPFWYRLFTDCGIRVQVSSTSSYANYEKGVHSVMSDNICFPAKLVHSHIYELDDREDIDRIFFPRVMYEPAEDKTATSSLNCPVIIGYPEVIHSSVKTHKTVDSPVISFRNSRGLLRQVTAYLLSLGVPKEKIRPAFRNALADQQTFAQTMRQRNLEVLERAQAENRLCILLAGRPYHTDPLIQHNVSEMIADMGVDVLTEDIVRHTDFKERESFILKQWTFVNRILNAAQWVAGQGRLVHIVETTSFGCGPDAFFVDEVRAILNRHNKPFTLLKIDDINNIGSMRLRVRSLVNSLQLNKAGQEQQPKPFVQLARFEKGDKHKRVILAPYFTEYLSPLMPSAFEYAGYKVVQLPMGNAENNELGLRYANNEVCYPATLIVGGFIKALQSGEYDPDKTAIAITQLGKCRATNYPALIRRAIVEAGFSQVPVIGIGGTDNMDNPGFRLNYLKVAPMVMAGTFFTDWLAVFYHAIAVRENVKGTARALRDEFLERAKLLAATGNAKGLVRLVGQAAEAFNAVPVHEERIYPKVGITGEIFLKFNPYSHRYVPDWLMAHGVEVVPSAVHNFFLRSFVNYDYNKRMHVTDPLVPSFVVEMLWKWIHGIMLDCEKQASVFRYFRPFPDIRTLSAYAGEVLELSAQFGEGWLLPAEVIGFLHEGCNNVVSMQPFGCIANHIVARGIEKKLKTAHPELNMLSLDFDGGVSESNIANRLLLFLNGIKYK